MTEQLAANDAIQSYRLPLATMSQPQSQSNSHREQLRLRSIETRSQIEQKQ